MPSTHGQNFIMEKQKSVNSVAPAQLGAPSCSFICTVCGDGFSQYNNVLAHMTVHGPLESFSFDGSSNGFEFPQEYVLQENGTLTAVNGITPSSMLKPPSPGLLPSHLPSPVKPLTPTLRSQPPPYSDVFRSKPSDLTIDKSHQGNYRCEICNRSFNSLQSLHRHQQYRNTERGYKCTLCCKIFEGRQELKKHLQVHANEGFHCCGQCGKRFLKMDSLIAHHKEIHSSHSVTAVGRLDNKREKKSEKTYPCKKCRLIFFWMSDFQTHSLYHCQGKEPDGFASEIEVEVNSKSLEDSPLENCHNNGTSIDLENEDSKIFGDTSNELSDDYSFTPYRCGLCGDRFQKLTALKDHHLTHQTQEEMDQLNQELQKRLKRHPCKQCHRVFNHSSSLSRHMRYHKGTMHTCSFCGRHFPQRCDLRRHVAMYHKTEVEKKPGLKLLHAAPQKGSTPNSLNGEITPTSPDEKNKSSSDTEQNGSPEQTPQDKQLGKAVRVNYKCQECGKRFGLLCVYQRHLRYHKKEPRKCPQCPARFTSASSLERHLQTHPSNEEMDDDGQTSLYTGTNRDPVLEKCNAEDMEEDFMDHSQKNKGNSSDVLYECTECTETFSCLETFLQHQTSHGTEDK